MNEAERTELKRRLLQYPGTTEEIAEKQLYAYEQREKEKVGIMEGRNFSNAMAEHYLDRKGYPRPPGWHSVLFYPGSNRLRNQVVFWFAVIIGLVWFFG